MKGCTDHTEASNQYIVNESREGNTISTTTDGVNPDYTAWQARNQASGNNTAQNSSITTTNQYSKASPAPAHNFAEENAQYIEHLASKIVLLKEIVHKLERNPFFLHPDSKKPVFNADELKQFDEQLYLNDRLAELAKQAWDDRNTIPTATQFHLANMLIHTSIKKSASLYISKVKELFSLSSKQVTKTLKGVVRDVHYIYEPSTMDEALIDGFYGKQCPDCKSWRVKYEFGMCHCFACDNEYHAVAEPLPKAGLSSDEDLEGDSE